jgi:hypothetical protein
VSHQAIHAECGMSIHVLFRKNDTCGMSHELASSDTE